MTFGYDGYGRVNAVTDSDGYVVTAQYDLAGRVTRTTYPGRVVRADDLRAGSTRASSGIGSAGGRTFTYNGARQLVSIRDPLGRITTLDRCGCGSLDALVDGNGNRTRWDRDVEGRVIAETRADGAATHYTYENTTPRLKQVTDRKGQVATYSYFKDDAFKQKTYTNSLRLSAQFDAVSVGERSFARVTVLLVFATLVCSCGDTSTVWTAESRSPDGKTLVRARTVQPSGIGTGDFGTFADLNWTVGSQPPVVILAFAEGPNEPGGMNVGMNWLTPTHLELTYKGARTIDFQAIKWHGVDISVRDLSAGPDNFQSR